MNVELTPEEQAQIDAALRRHHRQETIKQASYALFTISVGIYVGYVTKKFIDQNT